MDVIDSLAGIAPGSPLDALRRTRRPTAREQAQKSYEALFAPAEFGGFGAIERYAVAVFVAGLHSRDTLKGFYAGKLRHQAATDVLRAALDSEIEQATMRGAARGPYGAFPQGPLSPEDRPGPLYRVTDQRREVLGPRLAAALEHVHMLVFHPRDADVRSLQALLDAGWTTTEVVTLSQLVAFLAFQIRVVAGLAVLAAKS
jgi:CMD domain protein